IENDVPGQDRIDGEASQGELHVLRHALIAHELRQQESDPRNRQQCLLKPGRLPYTAQQCGQPRSVHLSSARSVCTTCPNTPCSGNASLPHFPIYDPPPLAIYPKVEVSFILQTHDDVSLGCEVAQKRYQPRISSDEPDLDSILHVHKN